MTVSQGSVVTQLSCGGIFNDSFVANFLLSLSVKELWKSVNICQRYWRYRCSIFGSQFTCTSNFSSTFCQTVHYNL